MGKNLIRYSQQEASEGSYLNAILILNQATKDILKRILENKITSKDAEPILIQIDQIKSVYLEQSKIASPKRFVYDRSVDSLSTLKS